MRVPRPFEPDPEEIEQPQGKEYKKHVEREEKPLADENQQQSEDFHGGNESTESLPDSPNEVSRSNKKNNRTTIASNLRAAMNLVRATVNKVLTGNKVSSQTVVVQAKIRILMTNKVAKIIISKSSESQQSQSQQSGSNESDNGSSTTIRVSNRIPKQTRFK